MRQFIRNIFSWFMGVSLLEIHRGMGRPSFSLLELMYCYSPKEIDYRTWGNQTGVSSVYLFRIEFSYYRTIRLHLVGFYFIICFRDRILDIFFFHKRLTKQK